MAGFPQRNQLVGTHVWTGNARQDAQASQNAFDTLALFVNQLRNGGVIDGAITLAKLAALTGLSVIGNATDASGTPTAIMAGSDGHVLRRSGTTLGFGQLAIGAFADAIITFAKLQNFDALSVLGRSANSSGVGDEIAAGTDGHILRRSGSTLGFGKILTNFITGTATNDNATAGDIGEQQLSEVSGIGSWVNNTVKNVTSLSLTAGDWDVEGAVTFLAGTFTATGIVSTVSLSSAAEDLSAGQDGRFDTPTVPSTTFGVTCPTGTRRISIASTTTVYLTGRKTFSAGTPSANAWLRARRVR